MSTRRVHTLPRASTRPRKHCDRCDRIVLHGGVTIYDRCATCEGISRSDIMRDVADERAVRARIQQVKDKHDFCAMHASANESWKRLGYS